MSKGFINYDDVNVTQLVASIKEVQGSVTSDDKSKKKKSFDDELLSMKGRDPEEIRMTLGNKGFKRFIKALDKAGEDSSKYTKYLDDWKKDKSDKKDKKKKKKDKETSEVTESKKDKKKDKKKKKKDKAQKEGKEKKKDKKKDKKKKKKEKKAEEKLVDNAVKKAKSKETFANAPVKKISATEHILDTDELKFTVK